jgi:NAD(P)-dependent dehydrogenase (short-subunit alcohol dehydrogenase family)
LVTGTSTGIGLATVNLLVERGHHVFAAVRSDADRQRLSKLGDSVEAIILDVTRASDIQRTVEIVSERLDGRPLHGLVNNAGVSISGPIELVPIDDFRHQMEVNFFGAVALTQALLPLIREGSGRIVNVGSILSRVRLPFMAGYCASKAALETFTDTLRDEVHPAGVKVSYVGPGNTETPIWKKEPPERQHPNPEAVAFYKSRLQFAKDAERKPGISPRVVAERIHDALFAPLPLETYWVGEDAKFGASHAWLSALPHDPRTFLSSLSYRSIARSLYRRIRPTKDGG